MPNRIVCGGYRYAFQGQEKDPETGKEAFKLRLWDGRIGRWLTTDPKNQFWSPYLGMGNNPISQIDPDGGMSLPPPDEVDGGFLDTIDLGTIRKGFSSNTGYTPSFRDWSVLEFFRSQNSFMYNKIKYDFNNGNYYALSSGKNWASGFGEGYAAGWKNWDKNGTANGWMNIAGVGIGFPLIASNPVTPDIIGDLSINSARNMFINSGANFVGQITTNGFSIEKADYFDVGVSGVLSGSGSVFLQSLVNVRGNGNYGFNENFIQDYIAKSIIFGIHKGVGYSPDFSADITLRTITTHGAIGVSSVLNNK